MGAHIGQLKGGLIIKFDLEIEIEVDIRIGCRVTASTIARNWTTLRRHRCTRSTPFRFAVLIAWPATASPASTETNNPLSLLNNERKRTLLSRFRLKHSWISHPVLFGCSDLFRSDDDGVLRMKWFPPSIWLCAIVLWNFIGCPVKKKEIPPTF